MSTAREKLARLRSPQGTRLVSPPPQQAFQASASAQQPLFVFEQQLPPGARYGDVSLKMAQQVSSTALKVLARDPRFAAIGPSELLFLDTETTGLWGGGGTVPFLVGLGFIEDGSWNVEQLMLGQLGQEGPLLDRLFARLSRAKALVTYNGKSFDWPLIKARYLINRRRLPPHFESLPHLDLLFSSRRLLTGVPDHRLASIEEQILRFRRQDDIPGHAIPDAYFAFLRHRDLTRLAPVIEHNRLDIVAMMALVVELCSRLAPLPPGRLAARELLAVARLMLLADQRDDALHHAYQALCSGEGTDAMAAAVWAARLHGRMGAWRKAAHWLERALLSNKTSAASAAHLALAKIFEHRVRDLPRALRHAERSAAAEGLEGHQRRIMRLKRRLAGVPSFRGNKAEAGHLSARALREAGFERPLY